VAITRKLSPENYIMAEFDEDELENDSFEVEIGNRQREVPI
jgi:hypothetical protein